MVVAIEKNHPCTRMVRVAPLSDWANTPVTFTPGHPNNTVVLSITPLVLPTSECFATSRLQETKGLQLNRRVEHPQIPACPLKIEEPSNPPLRINGYRQER